MTSNGEHAVDSVERMHVSSLKGERGTLAHLVRSLVEMTVDPPPSAIVEEERCEGGALWAGPFGSSWIVGYRNGQPRELTRPKEKLIFDR